MRVPESFLLVACAAGAGSCAAMISRLVVS